MTLLTVLFLHYCLQLYKENTLQYNVCLLVWKYKLPTCVRTSHVMGRDSAVGIATRYGLDGPGIESRWWARYSAPIQTGPGAYPASCTMGTGSFPGVKRSGRGADHPPPSKCRGHERVGLYTSTHPLGLSGLL